MSCWHRAICCAMLGLVGALFKAGAVDGSSPRFENAAQSRQNGYPVMRASYAEPEPPPQIDPTPAPISRRSYTYRQYGRTASPRMAQLPAKAAPRAAAVESGSAAPGQFGSNSAGSNSAGPKSGVEEIVPTPDPISGGVQYNAEPFDDLGASSPEGQWDGGGGACSVAPCNAANGVGGGCDHLFGPWVLDNLAIFAGVQGFKGPVDQGSNGNFGFFEGVNWAMPIWREAGVGYQLGGAVVHSDLSGSTVFGDNRTQYFITTGLFYRPVCQLGLQGGLVLDYLHDDFIVGMDLAQFRTEISLLGHGGREFGFWSATHTTNDQAFSRVAQRSVSWQSTDMYTLFYRHRFCSGATGRLWAGFTGDGLGLLGGDAALPLTCRWALESRFNYAIPKGDISSIDAVKESWGVVVNLVWYIGRRDTCSPCNPYRPLFDVADNATFFVGQR